MSQILTVYSRINGIEKCKTNGDLVKLAAVIFLRNWKLKGFVQGLYQSRITVFWLGQICGVIFFIFGMLLGMN